LNYRSELGTNELFFENKQKQLKYVYELEQVSTLDRLAYFIVIIDDQARKHVCK